MNIEKLIEHYVGEKERTLTGKIIGLKGILGSGKTHFVKKLLEKMLPDLSEQVTSPTYNLCNIYKNQNFEIHHYDLYRIETEDELYDTGVIESIGNNNLMVFIEWVDLFPDLINLCDDIISIEIINDQVERNYLIETTT